MKKSQLKCFRKQMSLFNMKFHRLITHQNLFQVFLSRTIRQNISIC